VVFIHHATCVTHLRILPRSCGQQRSCSLATDRSAGYEVNLTRWRHGETKPSSTTSGAPWFRFSSVAGSLCLLAGRDTTTVSVMLSYTKKCIVTAYPFVFNIDLVTRLMFDSRLKACSD
jgi:hypothetical protein